MYQAKIIFYVDGTLFRAIVYSPSEERKVIAALKEKGIQAEAIIK